MPLFVNTIFSIIIANWKVSNASNDGCKTGKTWLCPSKSNNTTQIIGNIWERERERF